MIAACLVVILEGERDCGTADAFGLPDTDWAVTCNPMGAKKWRDDYTELLKEKQVIVIPDADEAGESHLRQVADSCMKYGVTISVARLPEGYKDLTDWKNAGATQQEFWQVLANAMLWEPTMETTDPPPQEDVRRGVFAPMRAPELMEEPDPMRPTWIWEDFLAEGSLAMLAAKPKVGKSTLGYELAAKVVHGLPFLGRTTRRGAVLILALEEHRREVKGRLRTLGLEDCDDLHVQFGPLDCSAETLEAVQAYVRAHAIVLVLIDTLNSFWKVRDENDAAVVTQAVTPLLSLARTTNAAVLLLHHVRKSEGEFGDEIRGSGALFSLLDVALILKRHDAETQRRLTAISRYPDTPADLILELRDHGYEALGDPSAVGKEAKRAKVLAALSVAFEHADDILTRAGVARRAGRDLLDTVAEQGHAERTGTGKRGDPFRYRRTDSIPVLPLDQGGGTK